MMFRKAVAITLMLLTNLPAQDPSHDPPSDLRAQVEQMREMIERQNQTIRSLQKQIESLQPAPLVPTTPPEATTVAVDSVTTDSLHGLINDAIARYDEAKTSNVQLPDYLVGYDRGFYIRPVDPAKNPFEMVINGRMQFRYTAVDRQAKSFTNQLGATTPLPPQSLFEIERGRLVFKGFFLDENLEYFLNIDFDTDDNHRFIAHDFWMNYKFSDQFNLHAGKAKVLGSLDWYYGSTRFRFADRSLATNFFKADRSVGVWASGQVGCNEDIRYVAMVSNGFFGADQRFDDLNDQFTYSALVYWDPIGEYGKEYSDLESTCDLAVRLGSTFAYSPVDQNSTGDVIPEQAFARLTDGTALVDFGIESFDTYLYTIHAAAKYQGWSVNSEYFLRWLESIDGGTFPGTDDYSHGYFASAGYFLVPKCLELNGRYSAIHGFFGNAQEIAVGLNWFLNGTHNLKLTVDLADIQSSPVSNSSGNHRVGEDGWVFRTQFQAGF